MRFQFLEDQLALQDAVRRFCAARLDLTRVADRENRPADETVWRGLTDLGVLALLAPDDAGAVWPVEAAIVFEELGRHLACGPVVWSAIAAPLVDGVADGTTRVTGVDADATPNLPVVIEHTAEADIIVVLRSDQVELLDSSALTDGVTGSSLDPLTPMETYPTVPAGRRVGDGGIARRLGLHGALLSAAALVGVAQGALDVASSYALERVQFGVPIGSFQAIKHLLADMYVRLALARAETYAAAAIVAAPDAGDPHRSVAAAKILAGEAGMANARAAIQILGGMGFTWDMLPHYYLKRAWVLDYAFGTGGAHAERLGSAVGEEVAVSVSEHHVAFGERRAASFHGR